MRSEEWGNAQKHFLWEFERQRNSQVNLPSPFGEGAERSEANEVASYK